VRFEGEDLSGTSATARVRRGIVQVPQDRGRLLLLDELSLGLAPVIVERLRHDSELLTSSYLGERLPPV
jgi:ABC-type branched-subunit amino acid transport system ATPase component